MRGKLLAYSLLAMAMSIAHEKGINVSPREAKQTEPWKYKTCKSCDAISYGTKSKRQWETRKKNIKGK